MSDSTIKEHPVTDIDKLIMGPTVSSIVSRYVYRGVIRTDSQITFIYILLDSYVHYITYSYGDSAEVMYDSKVIIPSFSTDMKVIISTIEALSADMTDLTLYFNKEQIVTKLTYDTIVNSMYMMLEDRLIISVYDIAKESHWTILHNNFKHVYYNTVELLHVHTTDIEKELRLLREENSKLKKQVALTTDKLTDLVSQLDPTLE